MSEKHPDRQAPLARAIDLQHYAAQLGLDWPDISGVMDKLEEETAELRLAADNDDTTQLHEEIGDLLFTCVNLARHASTDPEALLHAANLKFEQRFKKIEALCRQRGLDIKQLDVAVLDRLWNEVKQTGG